MGIELDKTVQAKKEAFLAAFLECGSITDGCKAANIGRQTHYDWKRDDPEYAAQFEAAQALLPEMMVDASREMAIRDRNPTMVIFNLKAMYPEIYSEAGQIDRVLRMLKETFGDRLPEDPGVQ